MTSDDLTTNENNPTLLSKIKSFFGPQDRPPDLSAVMSLEPHAGLQGQDIVTLSTQDWHDLWTRKQRFMFQFARQGNRVLYVETQFHWLSYIKQFKRHWRRIYLFLYGPREVQQNLYVYTPPLLLPAFQIFPSLAKINNFFLGFFLKSQMRHLGIKEPLLWLYSHFNRPLVKRLGARRALYECVDEFSGAKGLIKPEVARAQETETLRAVDVAIVTAAGLKASKERINRNTHLVPNAANVAHFSHASAANIPEPTDLNMLHRPRLVFIGATAYWIDLELLRHIALNKPSWEIVMVGPVSVNVELLKEFDNIHFVGRKPYDDLPAYLAWSDIALNPYRIDSVAENCSPLKLYEYLASGIPVGLDRHARSQAFPRFSWPLLKAMMISSPGPRKFSPGSRNAAPGTPTHPAPKPPGTPGKAAFSRSKKSRARCSRENRH